MGALEKYKNPKNHNEKKQIAKKNCLVRSVRERNRLRPNTYPNLPQHLPTPPKIITPKNYWDIFLFSPAPPPKPTGLRKRKENGRNLPDCDMQNGRNLPDFFVLILDQMENGRNLPDSRQIEEIRGGKAPAACAPCVHCSRCYYKSSRVNYCSCKRGSG